MNQQFQQLHLKALTNIRMLEPSSLIGHAIDALHETYAMDDRMRTLRPWDILLVLQWTLQEIDLAAFCRPVATRNDLHKILNVLYDLEGAVAIASPLDIDNFMLFMRKLAFQQFPIQGGVDPAPYARQFIMFGDLQENHGLRVDFTRETGVSPREFCLLSFGLLSLALKSPVPRHFNPVEFQKIESPDQPGSALKFFRFVARTIDELHHWLTSDPFKKVSVTDQRILPSPLLEAPLLVYRPDQFFIYHPALLMRALETMIYRTVKRCSPKFGDLFGKIYERYLERCLDCTGVHYRTEAEMQKLLPGPGKCVDFVVVENDCNILIDAKGVEMPSMGKVVENAEYLLQAIKPAVKAIRQGLETHQRMRRLSADTGLTIGQKEAFLLIVTVDDLYLGPNQNFERLFGASLRPRLEKDYGQPLSIPFENIFFLTVGEFEILCAMVGEGMTTLTAALEFAQQKGAPLNKLKLTFRQHLVDLGWRGRKLPFIMETIDEIGEECTLRANRFPEAV